MSIASLEFEHGSGRYVAGAAIFRFNAYDAQGNVLCAISQEAFTTLSGITHLDPDNADVIFTEWENDIFAIGRAEYMSEKRQEGGAVVIDASKIPTE